MWLRKRKSRPWLTAIVVFHNMGREAPRTLHSFSRNYQRQTGDLDYRVIAIDHGSTPNLERRDIAGLDVEYRRIETTAVSPVSAIIEATSAIDSEYLMVNIDGARILSPGLIQSVHQVSKAIETPFVYTLGWHLGPDIQNRSITEGYNQHVEDRLLEEIEWQSNGYRLFEKSALAGSSEGGFLNPIAESNCFAMKTVDWHRTGGFHPGFQTPGGGLVNLDFFKRAVEFPGLTPVCLLGEGTFHQIHGGVATNVPKEEHPMPTFQEEYQRIRGGLWTPPTDIDPLYFGRLPAAARRFVKP